MARRTQKQEQTAEIKSEFPYRDYLNHPAWGVIEGALGELESNDDVELKTAARYVVGLLVKRLCEDGLISSPSPQAARNGHSHAGMKRKPAMRKIRVREKLDSSLAV